MGRMGSRERMQRMALEKELEAKEKAEKEEERKALGRPSGSKRSSAKSTETAGRMKMMWQVYDPGMKEIALFPYPQKAQAEQRAAELTDSKGKPHGVRSIQVPMD